MDAGHATASDERHVYTHKQLGAIPGQTHWQLERHWPRITTLRHQHDCHALLPGQLFERHVQGISALFCYLLSFRFSSLALV